MNTNTSTHPTADPQSSTAASTSSLPLQRGKACLPCRRRKIKCDSVRPICTPCLRGERTEDCEYTDGQHRSRTLTLEEDVARLTARVQELENPGTVVPSVELYAPYMSASGSASGASSTSASLRQARPLGRPVPSNYPAAGMRQAVPHELPSDNSAEHHRVDFEANVNLHARRALSVITPHAAELGFFLNSDRLRVQGAHVLPALQSVLTLWSTHITLTSDPHEKRALTSMLLTRTQNQLASALNTVDAEPDPAIFLHVIQTGVLLAYYMQRIGQMVGARYYASGTWSLVMTLKLYRRPQLSVGAREGESQVSLGSRGREGSTHANTNAERGLFPPSVKLPPASDGIEAEERVRAFWAVYALDRWFCVAGEVPFQSLATEGSAGNVITVPWPGNGSINETRPNAVQHFLNDPNHDFMWEGALAMHAKTSVLLSEATGTAASFRADRAISQSAAFRARFGTLDTLLQRCLSTAMTTATVSQGGELQMERQAQALVTVHLVALAHVTLHRPFIATHGPSRRRSVEGALVVVRVLDQLGDAWERVGGISPIYPVVWTALCLALHEEALRLRARPDADLSHRREEGEMIAAIRKLVGALSALSQCYQSRFFAANIEALLSVLGSIAT